MFETTDIQDGKEAVATPLVLSFKMKLTVLPQFGVYDIAKGMMTGAVSTSRLCTTVVGGGVVHAAELTVQVIVTVIVSVTTTRG